MPAIKTIKTDGMGAGAFLIGQNDPIKSNEQVVLAATAVVLPAGTVLGKITANGKYVPLAPAASDGSQNAAGILYDRAEIKAADQRAVAVVRDQPVNGRALTYVNTVTAPQRAAAEALLATAMVIVRY
jgi:hypothetical protein